MMKRILYVEDDLINALVMSKLLKAFYDVVHVQDGESCMEKVKGEHFDMVLMDINLGRGKIDGTEAMKQIKIHQNTLPVLAVTSYAMPEDEGRFLNQGFDGYIVKPIDRKDLLEYIGRFFQ